MSSRRGWEGTVKIPTSPPTESPNRQDDYVSAHIRVYWPHSAKWEDVLDALDSAHFEAVVETRKMFGR